MKIALTTIGTRGDIEPFIVLAKALLSRHHQVRFCSDSYYQSRLSGLPVEYRAISSLINERALQEIGEAISRATSPVQQFEILRDFHLRGGVEHYRICHDAIKDCDIVICHAIHTLAQAAAMDNAKPWIRVVLDPSLIPNRSRAPSPFPNLGGWLNWQLWNLVERSLQSLDKPLTDILKEAGSQQTNLRMFRTPSSVLNLLACSESLTGQFNGLPPNFKFTGFWRSIHSPGLLPPQVSAFLQANPNPVVVSLGSMTTASTHLLQSRLNEVFSASNYPVIVQSGSANLSAETLGDRGMTAGFIDHELLFPHARCIVHHGGAGTSAAACVAGVPSVVIPHFGDQFYWASQLHQAGVAPKPVPWGKLSVERLDAAITEVIASPQMLKQATALQSRMSLDGGVQQAVELIESI